MGCRCETQSLHVKLAGVACRTLLAGESTRGAPHSLHRPTTLCVRSTTKNTWHVMRKLGLLLEAGSQRLKEPNLKAKRVVQAHVGMDGKGANKNATETQAISLEMLLNSACCMPLECYDQKVAVVGNCHSAAQCPGVHQAGLHAQTSQVKQCKCHGSCSLL